METAKELAKAILHKAPIAADKDPAGTEKAQAFCEGYKAFLDAAKTEREAVLEGERMLLAAGYRPYVRGMELKAGDKIYYVNRKKCLLASTIGTRPLADGLHINAAHIDAPRIDLKPMPLYEKDGLSLFKTHYYGGIRKYQWVATPLALHGVVYKADGTQVTLNVGENPGDPVFCINDLLPHLGADQNKRTLADGIRGEELNIVVGSLPFADEEVSDRIKLYTMQILNEQYGITEKDFIRAEVCAVPAAKAADVGFDRSLVGGYGQDDRSCAYTALMAEIECKAPSFTTLCVLTDKEEIGSVGYTGLDSDFMLNYIRKLAIDFGADIVDVLENSRCLSADVSAAYDPTFPDAYEAQNSTFVNRGVALTKYTGARGKSGTNDATAEMMAYVMGLMDEAGVVWQTGELGKVDQGGGGTVALMISKLGVDTVDIGVPVLSMHAPFEVTSKADVYNTYRAFAVFANSNR